MDSSGWTVDSVEDQDLPPKVGETTAGRGDWAPLNTTLDFCPTCDEAVPIWVCDDGPATIEQFCDCCSALLLICCDDGIILSVTDLDLERTPAA